MQKANEYITYTFNELAEVMKEIEVMLQSYHRIISYYAIDINEDVEKFDENEFRKEITDFTCNWDVPKRLANIRSILSERFDNTLGEDDMDDIERTMENIKYWAKPGDKPNYQVKI
ncbi:hypothetical protein [Tepidibacter hydrothermalis]|uniref:Uncharacterized protein n=1 Tax=Tepidibacter hydrothermalis TaxID=3036126 RepID=A0ABY8E757_9FIRM|nr:hypothetical protein [Tepidibacter hydrothermalis]WFD08718.1 hypothetical protein P4S50_09935 [Tepidibacter hydrothermalis]